MSKDEDESGMIGMLVEQIITLSIRGRLETLGLSIAHLEKVVGSVGAGEKLVLDGPNGPFAVSCADGFLVCASKTIDADGTFVTMYARLDESRFKMAEGLRTLWETTKGSFTVTDLLDHLNKVIGKPN